MGIQTTPTRATRLEHLRRALAAQSPLQRPPLRWWHLALLLLSATLGWAAIQAPGALADLAAYTIGDWQAFVLVRGTVIILAVYALVFVRSYHWINAVGLVCSIVGLSLGIGPGQITQEPLTLGYLLILIGIAIPPVRIIVRPNQDDVIRQLRERLEAEQ